MSDLPVLELGNETPENGNGGAKENPQEVMAQAAETNDVSLMKKGLSPEEITLVEEFSKKIDLNNSDVIAGYGAAAQSKIAGFSDTVLKSVRTKDVGPVGNDLSNLVAEIKNYESPSREKTGLFQVFSGRNAKKQMDKVVAGFSKVETNVDRIVSSLEGHQRQLLKDIALMDEMYNNNIAYFKELSLYIIAGKESLERFRQENIPKQKALAESTGDQMEAQRLNDMINQADRFEKRLHDLILSRTISAQMAPQIRLIQNNDNVLVEKIQSSIMNSIPLWKNQMVISLGLANSHAALAAQRKVSDMTNELLVKNSEMLRQGSVEVAREAERGIVSLETVQKTNENLIATINEVLEIQKKGSDDRAQAEQELMHMETELKNALLEAGNRAVAP